MRPLLKIGIRLSFIGMLFTTLAIGDTIIYTFSGIGSGSLGGIAFSDAAFTIALNSDTSLLTTPSGFPNDVSTPAGTPATFSITGVGSGTLTGQQAVFLNQSEDDVGIWVFSPPDFMTLGNMAFASYDLASDMGPISGTASALAEFLPTSINNEMLSMTGVSNLTFTADVKSTSPVPEPSTLFMLGAALILLLIKKVRQAA